MKIGRVILALHVFIIMMLSNLAMALPGESNVESAEDTFFCGDAKVFSTLIVNVTNKLGNSIDQVIGLGSPFNCKVQFQISEFGIITGYNPLTCKDHETIDAAITLSNPLPLNDNACVIEAMNKVVWNFKG